MSYRCLCECFRKIVCVSNRVEMKILFLDQSGQLGGAELALLDIAQYYQNDCCVGLLQGGPFQHLLMQHGIATQVLHEKSIAVRKQSSLLTAIGGFAQLLPVVRKTMVLSQGYDLIYANTAKALVVGSIVSRLQRKPLVYHLHDIIDAEHFSLINRQMLVFLANSTAQLVIANSEAAKAAFIEAGGRASMTAVVYNGFDLQRYAKAETTQCDVDPPVGKPVGELKPLGKPKPVGEPFVIGHFSRLSPWKGQHILLQALQHCPAAVQVILVGDALFGETEYVQQLQQQVDDLGLRSRVKFLGFRSDIPQLMQSCDLVAHTSVAAEPFGRVIVEAMLSRRPVVASAAGGALELVKPNENGWLTPLGDAAELASVINYCYAHPREAQLIGERAYESAAQRFSLENVQQQIDVLLRALPHR